MGTLMTKIPCGLPPLGGLQSLYEAYNNEDVLMGWLQSGVRGHPQHTPRPLRSPRHRPRISKRTKAAVRDALPTDTATHNGRARHKRTPRRTHGATQHGAARTPCAGLPRWRRADACRPHSLCLPTACGAGGTPFGAPVACEQPPAGSHWAMYTDRVVRDLGKTFMRLARRLINARRAAVSEARFEVALHPGTARHRKAPRRIPEMRPAAGDTSMRSQPRPRAQNLVGNMNAYGGEGPTNTPQLGLANECAHGGGEPAIAVQLGRSGDRACGVGVPQYNDPLTVPHRTIGGAPALPASDGGPSLAAGADHAPLDGVGGDWLVPTYEARLRGEGLRRATYVELPPPWASVGVDAVFMTLAGRGPAVAVEARAFRPPAACAQFVWGAAGGDDLGRVVMQPGTYAVVSCAHERVSAH